MSQTMEISSYIPMKCLHTFLYHCFQTKTSDGNFRAKMYHFYGILLAGIKHKSK